MMGTLLAILLITGWALCGVGCSRIHHNFMTRKFGPNACGHCCLVALPLNILLGPLGLVSLAVAGEL